MPQHPRARARARVIRAATLPPGVHHCPAGPVPRTGKFFYWGSNFIPNPNTRLECRLLTLTLQPFNPKPYNHLAQRLLLGEQRPGGGGHRVIRDAQPHQPQHIHLRRGAQGLAGSELADQGLVGLGLADQGLIGFRLGDQAWTRGAPEMRRPH